MNLTTESGGMCHEPVPLTTPRQPRSRVPAVALVSGARGTRCLALVLAMVVGACAEAAPDAGGAGVAGRPAGRDAGDPGAPGAAVAEAAAPRRGLDSALVSAGFAEAESLPRLRGLLVARHGLIERERYFNGHAPDRPANLKSASKSILSALVGIAIAEGHIEGLDQPIAPFFPEYISADADPRLRRITVGHLLSMRAGLEPTSFGGYGAWVASDDWVRAALDRPFVDEPGGRMLYSTGSTHLLSAVLTRATGMSTLAYARSRLMEPLGIRLAPWTRDPQGVYLGGNEMALRPRELFRFGELYRNGGRWRDRALLPADWIRRSWTRRTTSPYNGHGYGLGWWMRSAGDHDVYFAWGYGGQYLFIVPDLELTAVMISDPAAPRSGRHLRALHALLDDYFIPAAERGDGRG